ncbi:MAG TPA: hypothetical protein DDX39_09180 [Bacteroidales bacterium]|nr:MAG: hypothetical protein A2W98_15085 [Bacteroidetes bacterium GWF2_33_38]HBF88801.1 hypothetical protein [Bacteroidales bacterium]
MIHIATVHHRSDKWIDIQLKYIQAYIKSPYQIYAFLNGIKTDHSHKFFYSSKAKIESHAEKLNFLANKIIENAADNDLVIFIDGDAFPIREIDTFLKEKLQQFPLLAIKRSIDFGDCQPHPSFCVSTVGFWKKIKGDWNAGYSWKNELINRELSDVGGNLLKTLTENDFAWYPMIRNNQHNIHPQWFAIYDNLIYHHGAGFRTPISKIDTHLLESSFTWMDQILSRIIFVRRILYSKPYRENRYLTDEIFKKIETDFNFCENLGLINRNL